MDAELVLLRHNLRRVGKIAWHRLTAWAISPFTRIFDALWAPSVTLPTRSALEKAPLPTLRCL
jgi:hypothetical protein